MSLHPKIVLAFDEIDATVFSGDSFYDSANLAQLRYYIERWERETMNCSLCHNQEENQKRCHHCKFAYEDRSNNFTLKEE